MRCTYISAAVVVVASNVHFRSLMIIHTFPFVNDDDDGGGNAIFGCLNIFPCSQLCFVPLLYSLLLANRIRKKEKISHKINVREDLKNIFCLNFALIHS